MSRSLVSVIIPCFNAENCVGEAIESALRQDYKNIEVIVIDDGSTDDSLRVIQRFSNRIRSESGPNRGGCAARNRGVDIATGRWIQFLDADDILYPEKLSRMLPMLDDSRKEILFSDSLCRNVESGNSYVSPRPGGNSATFRFMLEAERLQTPAPVYSRRALLDVGGFDVELPCAQEYDLNLRLALDGWCFRRLPEVLYEVRERSGSVSADYVRVLRHHDVIFRKLLSNNSERYVSQEDLSRLVSWRYVRNARILTRRGDLEGARLAVSRARCIGIRSGIEQAFSWRSRILALLFGPVRAELLLQRLLFDFYGIRRSRSVTV